VIFTPLRQGNPGGSNFQIRTRLGPQAMANVLVREVKAIDANLAPGEVITMREQGGPKNLEPTRRRHPAPDLRKYCAAFIRHRIVRRDVIRRFRRARGSTACEWRSARGRRIYWAS
jgi:hypothetical protein